MNDLTAHLTAALIATGGQLHEIFAHMELSVSTGRSSDDALPVPDTLYVLLLGVLELRLADEDADALMDATRVLQRVSDAISEELLLVSPDL